jgi:hypothetical protein
MSYGVVWFKRDLRLHDHAALSQAVAQGPVLCLYIIEPGLWAQPDASAQHYDFIKDSLHDLALELKQHGGRLHVRTGDAGGVFNELFELAPFAGLHAHEETGNAASYARDGAVGRWCRQHQVHWVEQAQFGVVRSLSSRNHWLRHWDAHMGAPCHGLRDLNISHFQTGPWVQKTLPDAAALSLEPWRMPERVQLACGVRVSTDAPAGAPDACPLPLVDLAAATRTAKDCLHNLRREPNVHAGNAATVEKHASRTVQSGRAVGTRKNHQASHAANSQLGLGFD